MVEYHDQALGHWGRWFGLYVLKVGLPGAYPDVGKWTDILRNNRPTADILLWRYSAKQAEITTSTHFLWVYYKES